jgi:DNA replication protein DnaC
MNKKAQIECEEIAAICRRHMNESDEVRVRRLSVSYQPEFSNLGEADAAVVAEYLARQRLELPQFFDADHVRRMVAKHMALWLSRKGFLRDYDASMFDSAAMWLARRRLNLPGMGLRFHGGCGNGKTTICRLIADRLGMRFLSAHEIVSVFNEGGDGLVHENCGPVGIGVVLDDLGSELPGNNYGTKAESIAIWFERFYEHIKMRGYFLVFNTNMEDGILMKRYNERFYSRMLEVTRGIHCSAPDHRRQQTVPA